MSFLGYSGTTWYRGIVWLSFTAGAFALPIGIGLLVLGSLKSSDITLGVLTDGGQFALFASTISIETFYLVVRPTTFLRPLTQTRPLVLLGVLVGMALAITLFVISVVAASNPEAFDLVVLRWPSIALASSALIVAMYAVLEDIKREGFDPHEQLTTEQADLTIQFRSLGGDES